MICEHTFCHQGAAFRVGRGELNWRMPDGSVESKIGWAVERVGDADPRPVSVFAKASQLREAISAIEPGSKR